MGEGVWASFPDETKRVLTANGPALLAELTYVDEAMPDACRVRDGPQVLGFIEEALETEQPA